ncbi:siderophore-interacting protein [Aeromicrobium phragmitis]|uniref:Siderophore-interacting protein n=1 Tax=Aeromicrobium phragmitis TaxID=2478914 RepID=A0A3L8PTB3_9ACTN|nr:siderophore-interacting protein [Aeromicrobium phragmitis]RLV57242.1 siderophore-interacting protein [Aeromicrobium phragmitis]
MARTRRQAVGWSTVLRALRVVRVSDVSPAMRRVTLTGEQLAGFEVEGGRLPEFRSDGFDDHVKLLVPIEGSERPPLPIQGPDRLEWGAAGGRPIAKDYTPRRYDPTTLELDLDFVRHGDGFAAEWAERVTPGDPAWIVGPTRSLLLPQGQDWMLVAGDETALPAIGRLLEEWPEGWRGQVVVELTDAAHTQDLAQPPGVEIQWAVGPEAWIEAVRKLDWWPGEAFCWVAGETRTIRQVRDFLKNERDVARDCLDVTGYWRR